MAVTINPGSTGQGFDLVNTLLDWARTLNYVGTGEFNPPFASNPSSFTQWAGGNTGGNGVIFDGNFTYGQGGNFQGSVDNLYFGTGLTSGASGFGLSNILVDIDLGGGVPASSYRGAIYSLTHNAAQATNPSLNFTGVTAASGNQQPGLFDFFGDTGTVQNGTAFNDVLYSFRGNDTLNGGAGTDRFVFDRDIDGALAPSIGNDTVTGFVAGVDLIDLSGLESASFDTFAEVYAASSQVGANTVINFGSLGTITLQDVTRTALAEDDFIFAPAATLAEAA